MTTSPEQLLTDGAVTWSHDDENNLDVLTLMLPDLEQPIHVAFTPEALLELGRRIVHRQVSVELQSE